MLPVCRVTPTNSPFRHVWSSCSILPWRSVLLFWSPRYCLWHASGARRNWEGVLWFVIVCCIDESALQYGVRSTYSTAILCTSSMLCLVPAVATVVHSTSAGSSLISAGRGDYSAAEEITQICPHVRSSSNIFRTSYPCIHNKVDMILIKRLLCKGAGVFSPPRAIRPLIFFKGGVLIHALNAINSCNSWIITSRRLCTP